MLPEIIRRREFVFTDSFPVLSALIAGPESTIWAQRIVEDVRDVPAAAFGSAERRFGGKQWLVLDESGRYRGDAAVDRGVWLLKYRTGWFYGVDYNASGENIVVRFRLRP